MKSILLTGSTGFVGSRLLTALDNMGYSVNLLSRKDNSLFKTTICDFEDGVIPNKSLNLIDTVFHLASYTHDVRNSSKTKHLYQAINVDATIKLAELAVQNNVDHFIFVSSVKAGGIPISGKCSSEEEVSGIPVGLYGESKREAEIKLLEICRHSNMRVSIIRPALVYGPNLKGNLELMWNAIDNGRFLPIPNVQNRRSMIHVDDLVNALLLVSKDAHINGEIFNATDGNTYSSREIYETMCKILGKSIPKWTIPKVFFEIAAFISPGIRYKVDKLLGDECYSSDKLHSFGFEAQRSLREMNETFF